MKTIAKTQYTIKNYALHLNIYVSYIDKLLLLMSGCPLGHLEYDVNFWLILHITTAVGQAFLSSS